LVNRSFFDEKNLAEIKSDNFPDERLIVCLNPCLAAKRVHQREDLLMATEKLLRELSERLLKKAEKGKSENDTKIGIRVGRIIDKYHVAKHFVIEILNGKLTFSRNMETIRRESELDGLYVIRTNLAEHERNSSDIVRDYKRLGDVEKSFRTMKTSLLEVRPIYHHLEDRVRAHLLICMLAYYVVWHLRKAWSANLFVEEDLAAARAQRDPVLPAEPSERVKAKKQHGRYVDDFGTNKERVESFSTLLNHLATRCRNDCQIVNRLEDVAFVRLTSPTPFQEELLQKIKRLKLAE
jgi:transposase